MEWRNFRPGGRPIIIVCVRGNGSPKAHPPAPRRAPPPPPLGCHAESTSTLSLFFSESYVGHVNLVLWQIFSLAWPDRQRSSPINPLSIHKQKHLSQRMMRARVLAQGFTIVVLMAGTERQKAVGGWWGKGGASHTYILDNCGLTFPSPHLQGVFITCR